MEKLRLAAAFAFALLIAPALVGAQDDPEQFLPLPEEAEEREALAREPAHSTPLHFLVDLSMNSDYYTPRGLMVEDDGVSFQLLTLALLDLYRSETGPVNAVTLTGGFWSDFQTVFRESPYNEVDPIIGVDVTLFENWTLGATYVAFISPPHDYDTQHNVEFKVAFDDTDLLGKWALHPYVKPFWNFAGASPVVFGRPGSWDVETGIRPGVRFFEETAVPLKVDFPIFAAWGGKAWYGGPGTFLGHVSPGVLFSVPLSNWIPAELGQWSAYAGMAYSRIVNDNLFRAGNTVSGNDRRDVLLGSGGINVFLP
jgi:hypothetical protein